MISITPHPIAFTLFTIPIHWYGIIAALSFLIAWYSIPRITRQIPKHILEDAMILGVIFGILGARLLHVILLWKYYMAHPLLIPAVWNGGLAAFGGLLGGMLGVWLAARKHKADWLRIADSLAPWVFLAFALGRIANILNGEILGTPCTCPFAFIFPDGIPRHPVQVYSMLINIIIFLLGIALLKRNAKRGVVLISTLTAYATLRFIIEFFRNEPRILFMLDPAQIALLLALPLLIILLVRFSKDETFTPPSSSKQKSVKRKGE